METAEEHEMQHVATLKTPFKLRASTQSSFHSLPSAKSKKKTSRLSKNCEVYDEDHFFFNDDEDEEELLDERFQHAVDINGSLTWRERQQQLSARKRKIIQDILANFDLEKVMDKYRGDSVSSSLSHRKFRKWLTMTMPADKIHLNDRQWNEEFRQQVLEEFERKQDEREDRLAEAEAQRIQKLRLQGIIRDEDENKQGLAERKTLSEMRFDKRSEKKHQSIFKPNNIESQMEVLDRTENEARNGNRSHSGTNNGFRSFHGNDEETTNGDDFNSLPTYKSHLGRTKEEIKGDHPRIKELYEEEDLDQLYREAQNLVRRTTRSK